MLPMDMTVRACRATDIELVYRLNGVSTSATRMDIWSTHLKLALSIHIHPSFTTQRISSCGALSDVASRARLELACGAGIGAGVVEFAAVHGIMWSGRRKPLSLCGIINHELCHV